jgi:tRNA G18 (ribose-2'-O)-methylase SpoU
VRIVIADGDDPRLAPYRDLKDRDVARRDGLFVVEGRLMLERLLASGRFRLHSVMASGAERDAALLARAAETAPVYIAPQPAIDAVAGFALHRGLVALAHRPPPVSLRTWLTTLGGGPATLLVLSGLNDPDNVGAAFRNAAAFGAAGVILDVGACDPLYRKAIRTSAGTAFSVPFVRGGEAPSLLADLKAAGFAVWGLAPSGKDLLPDLTPPERLALVLGPEGPGLPSDMLKASRPVAIPMAPGVDSLNVAAAGAIALSHVFMRRRDASRPGWDAP